MDLSIIIVNYNARSFVLDCIKSVAKNYGKELSQNKFEIIVVDNNSTDGSAEDLEKVKEIKFIHNKENLGFSKGNNIGIKKSQGKYLLFLNPDTLVPPETLTGMLKFMDENPRAGASSCKLVLGNGVEDRDAHRGEPTPLNALFQFSGFSKLFPKSKTFSGYYLGWKDFDKTQEVDSLVGAFMIVRRVAGEQVGWWDEDYFFYGEDLEFCFQLKQKGWKIFYVPSFFITHFKGVTSGIKNVSKNISTANKETRRRATIARFNAMKIFYKKHYKENSNPFTAVIVNFGINLKLFWALHF